MQTWDMGLWKGVEPLWNPLCKKAHISFCLCSALLDEQRLLSPRARSILLLPSLASRLLHQSQLIACIGRWAVLQF